MKKDYVILALGILAGILVIERFRKKKDSVSDPDEKSSTTEKKFSDTDIMECTDAVNGVVMKKMMTMRFASKEAYDKAKQQMFDEEMKKCLNS